MKEEYSLIIQKSAQKELRKIPDKDLKKILKKISSLKRNPRPHDCKKLSGDEKYRVRQGDYRILYLIEDKILFVFVVGVGHRKDIYKK